MTCPNGHESQATDYCDTCGVAMVATETPSPQPGDTIPVPVLNADAPAEAATPADGQECPNCATANAPDALFCEACGYDFTTGSMPRTGTPAAAEGTTTPPADGNISPPLDDTWVAELWIDPQWYGEQSSPDPLPSAGPPEVITDTLVAQAQMREKIRDVTFCLMVATTLHSIAVGNLLPAWVKVVCVDINPSTVIKLADRGSFQTVGLVTDVEPFFRALVSDVEKLEAR